MNLSARKKTLLWGFFIVLLFAAFAFQLNRHFTDIDYIWRMLRPAVGKNVAAATGKRLPAKPFQGTLEIIPDRTTWDVLNPGKTALDGMSLGRIASFRKGKVGEYRQLVFFPPDYYPLRPPGGTIYRQITGGAGWSGPETYYLANPYLLIIPTRAWDLVPMDLFCGAERIIYIYGHMEERRDGQEARCWLDTIFAHPLWPGRMSFVWINAEDAGFRFFHVDRTRSENVAPESAPAHILNSVFSKPSYYRPDSRDRKNGLSGYDRRCWIRLLERERFTRIVIKLWREMPASPDDPADFEYRISADPGVERMRPAEAEPRGKGLSGT